MIKVIFDYKVFFDQPLGGTSKYIDELTSSLNNLKCKANILSPFHINDYLKHNNFSKTIYKFNYHYPRFTRKIFERLNKIYINSYIKKRTPDILHFTDFNKDYAEGFRGKKITTVYDLIHEKFEKFYKLPDNYKKNKKFFYDKMDHIICISENTKKDLIEFYKIKEEKISVIYLGTTPYRENDLEKNVSLPTKPFLLFVGHRKRYKNFLRFIKAFSLSKKLVKDFDIVCFGNQNFDKEEISLIDKHKLKNNIHMVSGNDKKLDIYFKKAALFVFPSLYEGFGLPLLEAMKNGCAISCSDNSSLTEIGNESVDFFSPENEESILSSLDRVLYSKDYKKKLIQSGYKKVLEFTWEKCAKKTLEKYKIINEY